jgi:hypothetical protein
MMRREFGYDFRQVVARYVRNCVTNREKRASLNEMQKEKSAKNLHY